MNDDAYRRLGELMVDEVLLRAGLAQTGSDPVSASIDFAVDTERESETVTVRCGRINSAPVELRFRLQTL